MKSTTAIRKCSIASWELKINKFVRQKQCSLSNGMTSKKKQGEGQIFHLYEIKQSFTKIKCYGTQSCDMEFVLKRKCKVSRCWRALSNQKRTRLPSRAGPLLDSGGKANGWKGGKKEYHIDPHTIKGRLGSFLIRYLFAELSHDSYMMGR